MTRVAGLSGLLILIAVMIGFSFVPTTPVAGELQISYLVSSSVDGSRFTAVWLENEGGELVKTLFVSTELAQGAFTVEGDICPDWIKKSHWEKASQASGISDKVPYSMRHSFAAWALTLRIDPNRLVRLMGHGTKKMIYEVYGDYIEGLEEDFWQILEYYGRDFAQPKMKASATMMEYQNGQAFVLPYQLPELIVPEQNKAPNPSFQTFL